MTLSHALWATCPRCERRVRLGLDEMRGVFHRHGLPDGTDCPGSYTRRSEVVVDCYDEALIVQAIADARAEGYAAGLIEGINCVACLPGNPCTRHDR